MEEPKLYKCHQCRQLFTYPPSHDTGTAPALICPYCQSEFVELVDNDEEFEGLDFDDEEAEQESSPAEEDNREAFVIHFLPSGFLLRGGPLAFPQSPQGLSLQDMIRFVVSPESFPSDHPVWRSSGLPGHPGDYVFTEEAFQNAISTLMEQTGMRRIGLTDDQIDELPRKISDEEPGNCAICQEAYVVGEELIVLPCHHQYHADCIAPWLKKVASCPICRIDLLATKEGEGKAAE